MGATHGAVPATPSHMPAETEAKTVARTAKVGCYLQKGRDAPEPTSGTLRTTHALAPPKSAPAPPAPQLERPAPTVKAALSAPPPAAAESVSRDQEIDCHDFRAMLSMTLERMALVCDFCANDIPARQTYWHCTTCHQTHQFEREGGCGTPSLACPPAHRHLACSISSLPMPSRRGACACACACVCACGRHMRVVLPLGAT